MTVVLSPKKALARVQESAEQIRNDETQSVGTVSLGDVIRQGDLYLVAVGVSQLGELKPTKERQLAPGKTQGSRHILDGKCKIFTAKDAQTVASKINALDKRFAVPPELVGPIFTTGDKCELTHPEHGNFALPAGETFAVIYQRQFAEEIRRQLD